MIFHEHPVLFPVAALVLLLGLVWAFGPISVLAVLFAAMLGMMSRAAAAAARERRCPFCSESHGPASAASTELQSRLAAHRAYSDAYERNLHEARTAAPGAPSE